MRVLVTWGSKRGGTAGIADIITEVLAARGFDVVAVPADVAPHPARFDAVIVGGALYANRWHVDARHFVERHARELRQLPTWLFSSGPLDHSAEDHEILETRQVQGLMAQIGALGHVTFGGRLDAQPSGFAAKAMAKNMAGDYRDRSQIRAWAEQIADALPRARPLPVEIPHGRSPVRVVEYGVVAWALGAAVLVLLAAIAPRWLAIAAHATIAPAWFAVLAVRYQGAEAARSPLVVATWWTAIAGFLDLALTGGAVRSAIDLGSSITGMWLPLGLCFAAAAVAGMVATMAPRRGEMPPARAMR